MIHVCPLSQVAATVRLAGAKHLITLLSGAATVERPSAVTEDNHLRLSLHDITAAQEGLNLPAEAHVATLLDFAGRWTRETSLVVHCYAGISRSTATAYIIAAAKAPGRDEMELAQTLRRLSPSATPNPRLIALADDMLGRGGRMAQAIQSIGRGADAFEGLPFVLAIDTPVRD